MATDSERLKSDIERLHNTIVRSSQSPRDQAIFNTTKLVKLRELRMLEFESPLPLSDDQVQWWAKYSNEGFWRGYYSDVVVQAQTDKERTETWIRISKKCLLIMQAIEERKKLFSPSRLQHLAQG